jgi:hypothetical protein
VAVRRVPQDVQCAARDPAGSVQHHDETQGLPVDAWGDVDGRGLRPGDTRDVEPSGPVAHGSW